MSKCIGCGVQLQSTDKDKDGYVEDETYVICERCFIIKNYGQNKVINKTNIDYMSILNKIRDDDVVVYVSSLLTLNLDYIDKFKKVILVLTKRDVLPKSIKDEKLKGYIRKKYNNLEDVIIVSAYKKYNLDILYSKLKKYKDSDIYFVGITNSGKSTLINEMIKSYNGYKGNITMSNYPSTTLGIVDEVIGNLKIKDTPGIVIESSIINYMDAKGIKRINSKKEIKPITLQIEGQGAVLIDEYFRIEYETGKSSMTIYMSNNMDISSISLGNLRLKNNEYVEYNIEGNQDLVVEDMGFIKFTKMVKIKVFYKNKVYMYIRDKFI